MKENASIILRGLVAWCEKKCSDEVYYSYMIFSLKKPV